MSVHTWIQRYRNEGIDGLLTKEGRGRKKILRLSEDTPLVVQSITDHRQSLKTAKAAYEASSGKPLSEDTFRRFLKVLATPIKESESGWVKQRTKPSTSIK